MSLTFNSWITKSYTEPEVGAILQAIPLKKHGRKVKSIFRYGFGHLRQSYRGKR